jgi:hypothetical protein
MISSEQAVTDVAENAFVDSSPRVGGDRECRPSALAATASVI